MKSGRIPANEAQRLAELHALNILDSGEEQAYDDLTQLAASICGTPIALVSLIDEQRQWFKSHHGLCASETPRELAFCAHAINQDDVFIVEDADRDDRFFDNPLVTAEPYVKFYAGAPLIINDNLRVGTLCVIDHQPRQLSEEQIQSLKMLARQVVSQLQLRRQLIELQALDKAKDEFLSMVSHELRTPLTSLYGSLEILNHEKGALSDNMQTMMDIALRNSQQLRSIVNDILDLARMEAGKLQINFAEVDLIELAKQSIELNSAYVDHFGCGIRLQLAEDMKPVMVRADRQRLLQVVANLISNAAKYSSEHSEIIVELALEDDRALFSVTNYGKGIPQDQQQLLFRKFQQLDNVLDQKLPGTGLGLNICKHIIDAHYGEIGFKSVVNQQTCFFFKLQLVNSSADS